MNDVNAHELARDPAVRRLLLFAVDDDFGEVDDACLYALTSLKPLATSLVVIVDRRVSSAQRERLGTLADHVLVRQDDRVTSDAYRLALTEAADDLAQFDEIVFSGNGWFGPLTSMDEVFERMMRAEVDFWELIRNDDRHPNDYGLEGFPIRHRPWIWTVARRSLIESDEWARYWSADRGHLDTGFADHFRSRGARAAVAFDFEGAARHNPGLFAPGKLIEAGCPVLVRGLFDQFPPALDQFAVILRPVLKRIEEVGYPIDLLWSSVVRTTPPRALNASAGMLEILPDRTDVTLEEVQRVCVVVHLPGLGFVDELLDRLQNLPQAYDLVITTTDGIKAARIRKLLERAKPALCQRVEVRVAWVPGGRDMGALLVGCRDILLGDDYDLIMRLHGRQSGHKPINVAEYSRRYQLDNLLSSPGYVIGLLRLFENEKGLGLVFPPMIHVGYRIMGRGWGSYRDAAKSVCRELGIRVPLDEVSPLAPFGGMWLGRPQALRLMAERAWNARDYGLSRRGGHAELSRLQERIIPLAAAETGYHCRTVLNHEHAEISFSAMEFKADQLSSTAPGYPAEQIHFLRRMGSMGRGGPVSLTRMYLNLHFPFIAQLLRPAFRSAGIAASWLGSFRGGVRSAVGSFRSKRQR